MDYYSILGVAPGASDAEVKRAYRRLSRRYHPGINPGDAAAAALFQRITEAYETLGDVNRRQQYDTAGVRREQTGDRAFEFSGFDFSVSAHGAQAATFSELFAEALHPLPAHHRGEPETGGDLHVPISLSFDEAMGGGERPVVVIRQAGCGGCGGAGLVRTASARCGQCHGTGSVRWARGHMVFTKACAACGGTGQERHRRCGVCAGQGRMVRTETVAVPIPPGVMDGTQLRLAGGGHAGVHGAPAGDLFIDVQVRPHPILRRERDDLHLVVPVAVHEAALGARIEVPSFDGPVRLKIPPGTQGGQRLRVSGRGAPTPAGGRGDLIIEVRLALPPLVDERSRELMKELGRLNAIDVRRDLAAQFQAGS